MRLFRYSSLLVLMLFLNGNTGFCQLTGLNVDSLNIKNFREEIYVQTDRDIYITGEQIWMKIYKMNRLNSVPVNVSKVIYLELLDNSGNIIKQLKTNVDGFSGTASLRLSDTLRTGNYLIRAYSNWMQNYSEDQFFYKYISVIDPFKNIERLIKKPSYSSTDPAKLSPDAGKTISGISIKVDHEDINGPIRITLQKRGNFNPEGKSIKLSIFSSELVTLVRELNIERDTIIEVPVNSIPQGASYAVLSDGYGKKLTGRWFFNKDERKLALNVVVPKEAPYSRQLVTLDITTKDNEGNPVAANLSVSVVKSSLIEPSRVNITTKTEYSALPGEWLSGLPEGELNTKLLTFSYDPVASGEMFKRSDSIPIHLPELGGQLVNGVLKSKLSHVPLRNTDISLAFVGKTARCQFLKTDDNGEFNFVVNNPGLSEIVIQPLKPLQSGYYVEFNQPFCTTFNDHVPPVFSMDSTRTDDINKAVISMQVNKIYEPFRVEKKTSSSDVNAYDFFGKADKTIRMADYIELTTVREVLKEIVPDIILIKRNKEYLFKLVNLVNGSTDRNPLVLVDGVPFSNLAKLLEMSSRELERIDILNTRYYYTNYVFDGIVSFTTKKGNLSSMEYDSYVFRQVFEGSQQQQEFYSPDHGVNTDGAYRIPDFRNTLYWKPDLLTGKEGKTSVTFFTSDEPGNYTVIIEGVSADGSSGIVRIPFTVKEK